MASEILQFSSQKFYVSETQYFEWNLCLYMLHMVSLINSCIRTNQTWVSFDGMLMHLNMKIWFSHILFTSMWIDVSDCVYMSDLGLFIYCCFVFLLTCPLVLSGSYTHAYTSCPVSLLSLYLHTGIYPCTDLTPNFHSNPGLVHICTHVHTHIHTHPLSMGSLHLHTCTFLSKLTCDLTDVHTKHSLYMASLSSCITVPPNSIVVCIWHPGVSPIPLLLI